ncbi:endonuclease/exonuclease/phosphatase family protein [Algirhabdus cladophorae]|uniref:endonuclease/exonuclease/phosphatase family protein n=1 Tax=Algirhabdus cladophorae TaxID=3377108 RepID=UPI003B848A5C
MGWVSASLICAGFAAQADSLRIASFNTELSRKGPGLLLRDIQRGTDDVLAVAAIIARIKPDIIALQDIDYDADNRALSALGEKIGDAGHQMRYSFALRPNTGLPTGLDIDGNGKLDEARDAQGYGRFAGDGGMALLSRYPVLTSQVVSYSKVLWRDVPNANLPTWDGQLFPTDAVFDVQRLSTTGHWSVPVEIAPSQIFTALMFHATPPVFDGPEDRNGKRNGDEIRLWSQILDGQTGVPPRPPFAIMGTSNLDPVDGQGLHQTQLDLLAHPMITDAQPVSQGGLLAADPDHKGNPALDTVDFDGPGNLRVDYVLPSADLSITNSGVFWPAEGSPDAKLLGDDGRAAGRHRLVWVDVILRDVP